MKITPAEKWNVTRWNVPGDSDRFEMSTYDHIRDHFTSAGLVSVISWSVSWVISYFYRRSPSLLPLCAVSGRRRGSGSISIWVRAPEGDTCGGAWSPCKMSTAEKDGWLARQVSSTSKPALCGWILDVGWSFSVFIPQDQPALPLLLLFHHKLSLLSFDIPPVNLV